MAFLLKNSPEYQQKGTLSSVHAPYLCVWDEDNSEQTWTQICPAGEHAHIGIFRLGRSNLSRWLRYYDSRRLMEIRAHRGLLLILAAPVWN